MLNLMHIQIRDQGIFSPGIQVGKIQIGDKHPGSATLDPVPDLFAFFRVSS
jgi:hypothetical protein